MRMYLQPRNIHVMSLFRNSASKAEPLGRLYRKTSKTNP